VFVSTVKFPFILAVLVEVNGTDNATEDPAFKLLSAASGAKTFDVACVMGMAVIYFNNMMCKQN
jgi:hypothetical protein